MLSNNFIGSRRMFWSQKTRPQTTLLSLVGCIILTLLSNTKMVPRLTKRPLLSRSLYDGHLDGLPLKFSVGNYLCLNLKKV